MIEEWKSEIKSYLDGAKAADVEYAPSMRLSCDNPALQGDIRTSCWSSTTPAVLGWRAGLVVRLA